MLIRRIPIEVVTGGQWELLRDQVLQLVSKHHSSESGELDSILIGVAGKVESPAIHTMVAKWDRGEIDRGDYVRVTGDGENYCGMVVGIDGGELDVETISAEIDEMEVRTVKVGERRVEVLHRVGVHATKDIS